MSTLLSILFVVAAATQANAVETWTCDMQGEVAGLGLAWGLGGQIIRGEGELECESSDGDEMSIPVKMRFYSFGFGFDVSFIESMQVVSAGIGPVEDPMSLMDTYEVGATAGATLLERGIDFDASLKVSSQDEEDFGFEVGLTGKDVYGLGVRLQGMLFRVKPL